VARQSQAAGCKVLGVEPDARMAEFAQRGGVDVEVSTFEAWEAAGREFDAVVSGESWLWVDPVAGAAKAAEVLGPGGRLAVFWITGRPSEGVDEAFAGGLPSSLAGVTRRPAGDQIDCGGALDDVHQGG
jgi:SAM-dependent methyltransferase